MKALCCLVASSSTLLIFGVTSSLATTGPSKHYNALVKITGRGIQLFEFIGYSDAPYGDLVPTTGPIVRGADMSFTIVNGSKKPQAFLVYGHKTGLIRPGRKAHLHVVFPTRGSFSFGSTRDKAASFHGVIRVV